MIRWEQKIKNTFKKSVKLKYILAEKNNSVKSVYYQCIVHMISGFGFSFVFKFNAVFVLLKQLENKKGEL